MEIALSPDIERLVRDKVSRGEFESVESIVEFALRHLVDGPQPTSSAPSPAQQTRALEEFFAEVDREPSSTAPPLSNEALSCRSLYNTPRNRR